MRNNIKFEDNSPKFLAEMDRKMPQILTAIGTKAVSIWQKIITEKRVVDTGRFRNSANYAIKPAQKKVILGSALFYSVFLEIGTHRMKARPTLKPTVLEYGDTYKQLTEQILKE